MALIYHSTYVQAPSVAVTTDNPGATYQVRHRRVNLDNGVSLWSPVNTTSLPATITPQGYNDPDQLLRDEILISDDAGVTWKIFPGGNNTGAQLVTAFDSNWANTNNQDTQSSIISSLDFGTFSDTDNPSVSVFVVNKGISTNNIKVNFLDLLTGSIATSYMGLIRVDIDGSFEPTGIGPSSLYNQGFVWASPQVSRNNLELVLPTNGFFKLDISFENYPASGLSTSSISLGLELVANQKTYFLGFGSDWLTNSYHVDQLNYKADFIEANSETQVKIGAYLVNINGVLFTNFGTINKTIPGVDTGYQLVVTPDGNTKILTSTESPAASETLLATFDINSGSPYLQNLSHSVDIKPRDYGKTNNTVTAYRFVNIDTNGDLVTTDSTAAAIGISLLADGCFATSGLVRIQVDSNINTGDKIIASTDGKGQPASGGPVVALEGGSADDIVLARIINMQGPSLSAEPPITAGTTDDYWRGDKTFQPLNAAAISDSSPTGRALLTAASVEAAQNAIDYEPLYFTSSDMVANGSELTLGASSSTDLINLTGSYALLGGHVNGRQSFVQVYVDGVKVFDNRASFQASSGSFFSINVVPPVKSSTSLRVTVNNPFGSADNFGYTLWYRSI